MTTLARLTWVAVLVGRLLRNVFAVAGLFMVVVAVLGVRDATLFPFYFDLHMLLGTLRLALVLGVALTAWDLVVLRASQGR